MRIFEIFNMNVGRSAVIALNIFIGMVAAGSACAASMTVSPESPVAKPNATTVVEVKFVGLVLYMSNNYVVCAPLTCKMLYFPIKLYDGDKLTIPYFSGPITCGPKSTSWLSNGVWYDGCDSPVVKVTIPAKSIPGKYAYTVTHDGDTFTNSTKVSFVVSVTSGAAISSILPLLLEE